MDQSAFQNAINEQRRKKANSPFQSALEDIRLSRREVQLPGGVEGTKEQAALQLGQATGALAVEAMSFTPGPVMQAIGTSGTLTPAQLGAAAQKSAQEVSDKNASGLVSQFIYGVASSAASDVANMARGVTAYTAPYTMAESFARGAQQTSASRMDSVTANIASAVTQGAMSVGTLAASTALTGSPVPAGVAFFAKGAGATFAEYEQKFLAGELEGGEQLSQADRYVAGSMGGAIESTTEYIGGRLIMGTAGRLVKKIANAPLKNPFLAWSRATTGGALIEGGEEGLTTPLQEQVRTRLTREKTPTLKETALNAAVDFAYGMAGGVGGTVVATPFAVAERNKAVKKLDEQLAKSETEYADPMFWDKMTAGRVRSLIPMSPDERVAEAESQREAALVARGNYGSAVTERQKLLAERKSQSDALKKAQRKKDAAAIKTAEDAIADLTTKIDTSEQSLAVLAADAQAADTSYLATVAFIAQNSAQVSMSTDDVLRQNNATSAQAKTEADNKAAEELKRLGYDVQFYDGGQAEQVGFYDPASPNTVFLRSGQTNVAEAIGIGYEEAVHGIQYADAGLWKAIRQMHSTSAAVEAAVNYFNQQANAEDIAARGAVDSMTNPQQGPVTAGRAISNRYGSALVTAEGVANDIRDGVETLFRTGQAPGLLGQIITRMGLRGRQAATALRVRNLMLEKAATRQRTGVSEFGQRIMEAKTGIQARAGLEQETAARAAAAAAPATPATPTTPAPPATGTLPARTPRQGKHSETINEMVQFGFEYLGKNSDRYGRGLVYKFRKPDSATSYHATPDQDGVVEYPIAAMRDEVVAQRRQSNRGSLSARAKTPKDRGPIESAKAAVEKSGRVAVADSEEFFKNTWAKLLEATKQQVKNVPQNYREAARRAVSDIGSWIKTNERYADYYAKDWQLTRKILNDYIGRDITDDEFLMYRAIVGLTSPNTMLPSNISDSLVFWDYWMKNGNFDAFTLGPKPVTGALVVFEAPDSISGTTGNTKVRTIKIVERLTRELGSVGAAVKYLQEGISVTDLHKFNRKMGYAGAVSDIGNIRDLVKQATGQDTKIPRMFIFGQKVGAYTLNALGDEQYTTVDIWESRFIRSYFKELFAENIGLPENTDEHKLFTRFNELFREEMEKATGRKWTPASLQALRWFYIIDASKKSGYTKASTNETISFYTNRRLQQAYGYAATGDARGAESVGATEEGDRGERIQPQAFQRDLADDIPESITDERQRKRIIDEGFVRYARYQSSVGGVGFGFDERRLETPRQHGVLSGVTVSGEFAAQPRLANAYERAGIPAPVIQEIVVDANSAEVYRSLVLSTNQNNPYGAAVYAYPANEYQQKRLFVTADGKAGLALSSNGDIVSLFSEGKSGYARALMTMAVQAGGVRLDCFDTVLPPYYAAHGFRAVSRLKWNDEFAPEGWDKQKFSKFNNGQPDVVFMVFDPSYYRAYKTSDGTVSASYDDAVAKQEREVQKVRSGRSESSALAARQRRVDTASSDEVDTRTMPAEFYSALARGIESMPDKPMRADQWLQAITSLINKGQVKAEELFWSGLQNKIQMEIADSPERKFTRADMERILSGGLSFVTKELKDPSDMDMQDMSKILPPGYTMGSLEEDDGPLYVVYDPSGNYFIDGYSIDSAVINAIISYNRSVPASQKVPDVVFAKYGPSTYSSQTLSGGSNYREMLIVVNRAIEQKAVTKQVIEESGLVVTKNEYNEYTNMTDYRISRKNPDGSFTGVRFGDANGKFTNEQLLIRSLKKDTETELRKSFFRESHHEGVGGEVLLHYRTTDRSIDGKQYLFIEELQSDWGQKGRKRGFREPRVETTAQLANAYDSAGRRREDLFKQLRNKFSEANLDPDLVFEIRANDSENVVLARARRLSSIEFVNANESLIKNLVAEVKARNAIAVKQDVDKAVARGPIVTSTDAWVQLGMKQILMQAVNEGYYGIAFINGRQEAQRNQQIFKLNSIEYQSYTDPINGVILYDVSSFDSNMNEDTRITLGSIEDVKTSFGSRIASMIEKNDGNQIAPYSDRKEIDLSGMEFGAEAMQSFYESIIPLNLKKLMKKLGGPELSSVTLSDIGNNAPSQIALDITDALEANVRKGLSLFARKREQRQESLAYQMGRRSGQVGGMMKGRKQGIQEGKEEQRRKEVVRRSAMRAKFAERVAGFEQRIENAAQTNSDLRTRLKEVKAAAVEKRADLMDRARSRVLKAWFAGQQKGSSAGYAQAKKDMVAMRKEALEIIKLLPQSMRGAYGNALATMKTVAGIDRIARSVVQDLATADAVDMVGAINRMDRRTNKVGLRNDTRDSIISMLDTARGMLASGRNRLLPFTNTTDLASRTAAAGRLLEQAVAMFDQERADYRMERDARAAEFEQDAGDLAKTMDGKKGLPAERLASDAPRRGAFAQLLANNGNMDIYTIIERLEGAANGVLGKLWNGLMAGKDAMLKDRRDLDSRIEQALRRAGYDGYDGYAARAAGLYGDATAETVEVKIGGEMRRITVDQMMHLAALDDDTTSMLMDETDPERPSSPIVFATYRYEQPLYFTKQEHEALMASLTPRQTALIGELKAILESSVQPRVFEIHFQQQGKQPPRVEGYFPRSRLSDEVGGEVVDPNMQPGQVMTTMLNNAGFLQKRVRSSAPLVIGGMMRTFDGHIDEALRLIHMSIPLRHAMTVLRRRGVRANIERIMGRGSNDAIRMLVLNGVGLSGKPRGDLVETVNSNISGALITINPKTWLRQLGGAFRLLTEFDAGAWAQGMVQAIALTPSQRSQQIQQIEGTNGYFYERHRRSQVGLFANVLGDPRTGREQFSNGMRAVGRALATAGEDAAAGRWLQAANDVRQGLAGVGRIMRAVDFALRGVDRQIMLVAYNSALVQLRSANPTMPNIEQAAASMAEQAFRKTQNVSDPLDDTMYSAQQKFSRGLGRFMFPFSSDPLKAYNQLRRAYASGDIERSAKATAAVGANMVAGAAVNPLWAAAGLAIASAFGSGDDDEVVAQMVAEKEKSAAARKIASEVMAAAFGNAGLLASGIIEAAVGDPRMAEDVGEPLAVRALGDFSVAMASGQYGRAAGVGAQMAGVPIISPIGAITSTVSAVSPSNEKLLTAYRKLKKDGTLTPQQVQRMRVLEYSERLRKLQEKTTQ